MHPHRPLRHHVSSFPYPTNTYTANDRVAISLVARVLIVPTARQANGRGRGTLPIRQQRGMGAEGGGRHGSIVAAKRALTATEHRPLSAQSGYTRRKRKPIRAQKETCKAKVVGRGGSHEHSTRAHPHPTHAPSAMRRKDMRARSHDGSGSARCPSHSRRHQLRRRLHGDVAVGLPRRRQGHPTIRLHPL